MKPIRRKIHDIAEDKSYFSNDTLKRDNLILLFSIVVLILLFPLFETGSLRRWFFDIIISGIVMSAVTSLEFKKEKFIRLSYFSVLTFILIWIHHFVTSELTKIISFAVFILYLIYITFSMILYISGSRSVSKIILLNAINSYLLIGLVGGFLFVLVDVSYSYFANGGHALNFNAIANPSFQDYIYFSFITLTTLGYGDITPIIPIAKSLTIALSLTGQLYLTILVAMLVGKFLSQSEE